MKDSGLPALSPVTFPHPPERKRCSWGCLDVEEQRGRKGLAKNSGVRPAEALAKERRMERRAMPPAGVCRGEAAAGEGGSRGPGALERQEASASCGVAGGGGPSRGLVRGGRGPAQVVLVGVSLLHRWGWVGR